MRKIIFKKSHRILSTALAAALFFAASFGCTLSLDPLKAYATTSQEAQNRLKEIESQTEANRRAIDDAKQKREEALNRASEMNEKAEDLSAEVSKYNALLSDVRANIDSAEAEMASTQEEVEALDRELADAVALEREQYDAMKKRIAYIYEHRNSHNMLNIFISADSIADALNEARFVESLAEYDRAAMKKYESLQDEIKAKMEDIAKKQEDIAAYQGTLNSSAQQLAELQDIAGDALMDASSAARAAERDAAAYEKKLSEYDAKTKALESQAASAQAMLAQAILKEQQEREAAGKKKEDTSKPVSATVDDTAFLAATIQAEAGNQGYVGQVAVGSVIMNRVNSSLFPNTINGVITQQKQFASYSSGKVNFILENGGPNESCTKAAKAVIGGTRSGDWLFFMTKAAADGFGIINYEIIGDHVFFYKWVTKPKDPEPAPAETPAQPEAPAASQPETPAPAASGEPQPEASGDTETETGG